MEDATNSSTIQGKFSSKTDAYNGTVEVVPWWLHRAMTHVIGRSHYCTKFSTTYRLVRLVEWSVYCLNLKYNTKFIKKKIFKKYPQK